jgi:hypothetical protein
MTTPITPIPGKSPSVAFFVQSTISFIVSTLTVVVGIVLIPVEPWVRAFLALGTLYAISSAFTLAKVVRDRQEESYVASRVDQARMDKLIAEHDPYK